MIDIIADILNDQIGILVHDSCWKICQDSSVCGISSSNQGQIQAGHGGDAPPFKIC